MKCQTEDLFLSYCMIVKDEAETLEENLSAARPWVDKIVVVDTGSSDGSVKIAKKYADVVKCIEWPDSFSEARNVSLAFAEGDYVMYLDGDEAIKDPEHWKNIRRKLVEEEPDALAIQIENELPGNQILSGDRVLEVRVFRNDPEIQFKGRVHNQIVPAVQEAAEGEAKILAVKAVSEHIGYSYSSEELKEKYQGRIKLMRQEIVEADTKKWEHYYRYQLVNGLFMLKELDKTYVELVQVDEEFLTEENKFSLYLIATHTCLGTDKKMEADEYASKMMELWGQEPIGLYMKSLTQLRRGRFNASLSFWLAALQVAQIRSEIKYDLDLHYIATSVCEAALKIGNVDLAYKMFKFHLDKYQTSEVARVFSQIEEKVAQVA